MIVTITSIRLKTYWHFFSLARYALFIMKQLRTQPGFIAFKKRGIGRLHFTMSAWKSEKDMRAFVQSGAHLEAMKQTGSMASELRSYTFETDDFPDWKKARELVLQGRVMRF